MLCPRRRLFFIGRLFRSQAGFDQLDDSRILGTDTRTKSADHLAVAIEYELFKVPGNVTGTLGLHIEPGQMLVERARFVAIDTHLGKHIEGDLEVVGAELANLRSCTGLLVGKLVAGKTCDREALLTVLGV